MLRATERVSLSLLLLLVACCRSADDHVRNGTQLSSVGANASDDRRDAGEEGSEFPEDLFTEEQRRRGAIVLHAILSLYCFAAIATVCTEYFLPTIRCICQDLRISDDVAAATFMSAATASPELFSNIIGTFVTKSDIGVGHVLGNAYYDMFFVAAVGGLAAKSAVTLDWWPVTRDCVAYLFVAAQLTIVIWDGVVTTGEAVSLLASGVAYFVIMFANRSIIRLARERFNVDVNDPVESESATKPRPVEGHVQMEAVESVTPPVFVPRARERENKYWRLAKKVFLRPLFILTSWTIPDVRKEKIRRFYPLTFVMCVLWIGVSTYFGTWMISTIGGTIGVPDSVMGMVFMAAGGSVVEVYAVFYKVRRGECSIGLSNSMGCNTLDITFCLALPWLVRSLVTVSGSTSRTAVIHSPGMQFNSLLLLVCVLLLLLLLAVNRFRFTKLTGVLSGVIYISVLTFAIWMETH